VDCANDRHVADAVFERIRANNHRFRAANERIRDTAEQIGTDMEWIPFLCECPVEECVEIVQLTRSEYRAVRADPHRFMTAVGHEAAERPVGEVVSRNDRYVIIEKRAYERT
jgi:hypothetical protein